jgi:glc operon protein GlcG
LKKERIMTGPPLKFTAAGLALLAWSSVAAAQVSDTRETIAYDGAKQIVETCMTMARAKHWPIAVWVLDASGQPVYFASMGAREIGITTARYKAETALRTGAPSDGGGPDALATPLAQRTFDAIGLFPVPGGLPILKDGKLIGAVGGGGGRPENGQSVDKICVQAGIDAVFKK